LSALLLRGEGRGEGRGKEGKEQKPGSVTCSETEPTPILPEFGAVFPLDQMIQIADVGVNSSQNLKLICHEIIFEVFQFM